MQSLLRLARGIDWLNDKIGQVVYWLSLLMVLIGVYNASVRYLGNFVGENLSSNAYLEMQWYLFGAIFMLGASYTLRADGHVRVDILYSNLSTKAKAWIDLLGTLLFLLPFCIITLWLSIGWVSFSWKIMEMSSDPSGLPRYPIKTVIPVAFALLILQGISQLIKAIGVLRGDLKSMGGDKEELEGEGL